MVEAPGTGSGGEPPQGDGSPATDPASPPDRARRMRRSAHERMVLGVAGGIAEYFEVDPVLIRLAFVLLAIFGAGTGVLVYLVAWVVMPAADGDEARMPAPRRHRRRGFAGGLVAGLVLIVVGLVALLATLDAFEPSGRWILVGLAAVLVVIGAAIIAEARSGLNGGLVFWGVAATVVLVISLQIDLSFESGFGERVIEPTSAVQLESSYSHAFGSMRLDLRHLDLLPGTTRLAVDIAFGDLVVELPRDVAWRARADAVFGSIHVPGRDFDGIASDGEAQSSDWDTAEVRLDLEISSAFGSAEVRR